MKRISVLHIIYFITVSIGVGSFFIANAVVKRVSTSACVPIVLGIVFAGLPIFLICFAKKQFNKPDEFSSIFDESRVLKWIYAAFLFLACSLLCAHFTDVINMWILPGINEIFVSAGLCFVLFITLFKQERAVFYAIAVSGLFFVSGMFLIRSLIVFGGETEKILPLFEIERVGKNIIYPAFGVFSILSFASVCTLIFSKKANASSWVTGFLASGCAYFLIIYSCIVLLGAEQVAKKFDAAVLAMRKSDLLGRGDILYFIAWVVFMISAFVSAGYGIKIVLNKTVLERMWIYFVCSGGVFLISRVFENIKNITDVIIWFFGIGGGGLLYLTAGSCFFKCLNKRNKIS